MKIAIVPSSSSKSSSTTTTTNLKGNHQNGLRIRIVFLLIALLWLTMFSLMVVWQVKSQIDLTEYYLSLYQSSFLGSTNGSDADGRSDLPILNSIRKAQRKESSPRQAQQVEDTSKFTSTKKPMNVVIFFPDDWRHDSLQDAQPKGNKVVHTPFLTQLAKDGIRFTRNAVTSSVCWVSRATLFTGQRVSRHGADRLKCPTFTLPRFWDQTWVARLQRDAGYFVAHIGKWQFYNSWDWRKQAFNWSSWHEGQHWQNPTEYVKNFTYKHHQGRKIPAADLAKDEAIYFLRDGRPKDKPFAMTIAFYPPKPVGEDKKPGGQFFPTPDYYDMYRNHTYERPYNVTKAWESMPQIVPFKLGRGRYRQRWETEEQYQEGMRNYFALITHVDQACKEVVDELKRQNLYENTLIVFTTDNGMMLGNHGLAGKWVPWEESIRVPLIIYDPRMPQHRRGTLDDSFTLNIDLAETILGAAGLEPSPAMQGRDISDLYLTDISTESSLQKEQGQTQIQAQLRTGRQQQEKESSASPSTRPWRNEFYYEYPIDRQASTAFITRKWKYMYYIHPRVEMLFDLENDPYELNDLSKNATYADTLKELRDRHAIVRANETDPQGFEVPKCDRSEPFP